jgi:hypothetical protein
MVTALTAEEARLAAEEFILDHMDDQVTAGQPWFIHTVLGEAWVAPLVLTSSAYGIVGGMGAVIVDGNTRQVVAYTPTEMVKRIAEQLWETQKAQIEAAFRAAIKALS